MSSLAAWVFVGAGTILFSLTGLLILWPISVIFEQANRNLLHKLSRYWARVIAWTLPFWEIRVDGSEWIEKEKAYVIVSNHQSLLDILLVLAKLPLHFKFIAKRELFWIPFFGWHLWLAGYIPLKRGDMESGRGCLVKAGQWLGRGVSVLFFPEGTRSPDGKIHSFKPGAFKLALEGKVDILPLVIVGTRDAIPKHSWRVEKRSLLWLEIQRPVSVKELSIGDLAEIKEKIRAGIVERFNRLKEDHDKFLLARAAEGEKI